MVREELMSCGRGDGCSLRSSCSSSHQYSSVLLESRSRDSPRSLLSLTLPNAESKNISLPAPTPNPAFAPILPLWTFSLNLLS